MKRTKTYYSILGISKSSDQETIKKAYRALSKKHHPDFGGDQAKFVEVAQAYEVLGDLELKSAYDLSLESKPMASDSSHRSNTTFLDNILIKNHQKWDIYSKLSKSNIIGFTFTYLFTTLLVLSILFFKELNSLLPDINLLKMSILSVVFSVLSVYLFVKRAGYRKFGIIEQYFVIGISIAILYISGLMSLIVSYGLYFLFTKLFRSHILAPTRFSSLKSLIKNFFSLSSLSNYVNRINWINRGNVDW